MSTFAAAALLNLLGYITGAALYAMLLAMALGQARTSKMQARAELDRLPLLAALLGLAWNVGALVGVGLHGLAAGAWRAAVLPLIDAAAFSALGFLPAVVVHALLRQREGLQAQPAALPLALIAYGLSATAGVLHFQQAIAQRIAPSHWALHTLTIGFIALIVALLIHTRRRPRWTAARGWQGAGWALALAVFAVSALHLSHHEGRDYSWWIELIGHHASLPLALAILYQDYRFALADIFLKRALALVLLVALAFGLYLTVAAPLLARRNAFGAHDALAVGLLLGLWVVTALAYPWLRRAVDRFVDATVLRRADYEAVRAELAQALAARETPEEALDEICRRLSLALTARAVRWAPVNHEAAADESAPSGPLLPQLQLHAQRLRTARGAEAMPSPLATVLVPTAELPQYHLLIDELGGGRRLLSDDLALLEAAALLAARRIDAVRVVHERCLRDLHEEEMRKLATEAELRALRAQLNPHFLFNALTTIGYLIQTAPPRALDTLLRLTSLLRGVLRHSEGESWTLGEELELIESYLEIERARFEERLRVRIEVPATLCALRIPALLLQPLVENAIKHGIAPQRAGGEVIITARLSEGAAINGTTGATGSATTLQLCVRDTGAGVSELALSHGRARGVGLANIEQRLHRHFGAAGRCEFHSVPGGGASVTLAFPVPRAHAVLATVNNQPNTNGSARAAQRGGL